MSPGSFEDVAFYVALRVVGIVSDWVGIFDARSVGDDECVFEAAVRSATEIKTASSLRLVSKKRVRFHG